VIYEFVAYSNFFFIKSVGLVTVHDLAAIRSK